MIQNVDDGLGKIVDALFHRNANIFVRHAEKENMKQHLGSPTLGIIIPSYALVKITKYAWNQPAQSARQRISHTAAGIAAGASLELYKAGILYGLYELWKYSHR